MATVNRDTAASSDASHPAPMMSNIPSHSGIASAFNTAAAAARNATSGFSNQPPTPVPTPTSAPPSNLQTRAQTSSTTHQQPSSQPRPGVYPQLSADGPANSGRWETQVANDTTFPLRNQTQPPAPPNVPSAPPQQAAVALPVPILHSQHAVATARIPAELIQVQNAQAQLGRHKLTSNGKLYIEEPPGKRAAMSMPYSQARPDANFSSPRTDYAFTNPKFTDDLTRLTFAVQQSLPESVRRVVRDNWQKSLLGSNFHQAFVLNVSIHHSAPAIIKPAIRDFGAKMVRDCKEEIVQHFTTQLLDDVVNLILPKASDYFLDKCLAKRLQTIEAAPLINALAKAERLGYEHGDIIEDEFPNERVIPHDFYQGQPPSTHSDAPPSTSSTPGHPHPSPPESNDTLQCPACYRTFTAQSAYEHHTSRKVCSRPPPTSEGFKYLCQHCGQGFASAGGLQYHNAVKVCGDFGDTYSPPSRGPGRPARNAGAASSSPNPVPAPPQADGLASNGPVDTVVPLPASQGTVPHSRAVVPSAAGDPSGPYAHLTAEQMAAMQEELHLAELKYGDRFKEAEAIADPDERRTRLDGLRNSFGTKQSMIRKKYGVRLRERRTKAEILAERERMGIKASKEAAAATPVSTRNAVSTTASAGGSGWTAANVPTSNAATTRDNKRRRIDDDGSYSTADSPATTREEALGRKRVSVADMANRVATSPAKAATQGPTSPTVSTLMPSQHSRARRQSDPRAEIHTRTASANSPREERAGSAGGESVRNSKSRAARVGSGANAEKNSHIVIDDDSESSDTSDDEDIPAMLPAHVLQSLATSRTLKSSGGT